MKLKTISASSLQSFEECPRKFQAENVEYIPRGGNDGPAKLGRAIHGALKEYVKMVIVDKVTEESIDLLLKLFKGNFAIEFGTYDASGELFADGEKMCVDWFERTVFTDNIKILHLEEKYYVDINTTEGVKKYNYVWDRCDLIEEDGKKIIRVVDYKSGREYLNPEQLHDKLQARAYAFAAAVKFKDLNPDEIWVMFDLLRYGTVEVEFTREENLETWKYIRSTANKIIATPEPGEETLGPGCQFCVLNTSCKTLRKNAFAGGVMALVGNRAKLAEAQYELSNQLKGIKASLDQVNAMLLNDAIETDEIEFNEEDWHVVFKSRKTKRYDPNIVREIIGEDLFAQVTTANSVSSQKIDILLKSAKLDMSQKSKLRSSVTESLSDPKPTVSKRLVK